MGLPSPRVAVLAVMALARAAWAGGTECPTPAAVATELARLPDSGARALLERSEVTSQGRTLRLVLRDPGGQVLGVRELEAPPDCRQRAAVAAVMLAAWSHEWEEPVSTVAPTVPPSPVRRRRAELGLQGGLHHDGTGMAPGATVLGSLQLAGPLDAGVIAGFAAAREQPLGPGAIGYSLARAGAGVLYRAHAGSTWVDAGLFPLIVRIGIAPRNLPAARAVALWAGALEARFRWGVTWHGVMPFISASVGRRFVRERLTLEDVSGPIEVSPWDFALGLGLAAALGG